MGRWVSARLGEGDVAVDPGWWDYVTHSHLPSRVQPGSVEVNKENTNRKGWRFPRSQRGERRQAPAHGLSYHTLQWRN